MVGKYVDEVLQSFVDSDVFVFGRGGRGMGLVDNVGGPCLTS